MVDLARVSVLLEWDQVDTKEGEVCLRMWTGGCTSIDKRKVKLNFHVLLSDGWDVMMVLVVSICKRDKVIVYILR